VEIEVIGVGQGRGEESGVALVLHEELLQTNNVSVELSPI
jgi:hypothetical protein